MSDLDLEPLPSDIKRLLEAERPIPPAPAGLSPQLFQALAPKLVAAAAAPAATGVASGLLAKAVIAAVAFSAGAGAMHWVDVATVPPPAVVVPIPAPVAQPVPSVVGNLQEEQALVEQARAALSRGNPADAIAALEEHRAKFPSGQLAENREALGVLALAAEGKTDEAERKAAQFREKWPRSVLMPVVDQATSKKP